MLTIREILEGTKGKLIQGNKDLIIKGYKIDSRECKYGDLYIPLKGENTDGHRFISNAIDNGCIAILISNIEFIPEDISDTISIVQVNDCLEALQNIGRYNRIKHKEIESIAITGSVGKTSTREMISSVLSQKYNLMVTEKNMNGHIGLPLMTARLEKQDLGVFETGIDFVGEMDILGQIVTPDIAVITNIGTSHIGKFGSQDIIYREKTNIAKYLIGKKILLLNKDDIYLKKYRNEDVNIIYYSINDASNIIISNNSIEFETKIYDKYEKIKINAIGNHNIINAIVAIKIAEQYNMDKEDIINGIENYKNFNRRMEIINLSDVTIIDDTYNASPSSTEAGLKTIDSLKTNRKIAVLADIAELGMYSKQIHTNLSNIFKDINIDVLITFGNDIKYLYDIAKGFVKQSYFCENSEEAEKIIRQIMKKDDLIYFKGSNVMKVNTIIDNLKSNYKE